MELRDPATLPNRPRRFTQWVLVVSSGIAGMLLGMLAGKLKARATR